MPQNGVPGWNEHRNYADAYLVTQRHGDGGLRYRNIRLVNARLTGGRPRKAVKFSTAARYPPCVLGVNPRTVMSSIMRRRKGLIGLSVMALLLC